MIFEKTLQREVALDTETVGTRSTFLQERLRSNDLIDSIIVVDDVVDAPLNGASS